MNEYYVLNYKAPYKFVIVADSQILQKHTLLKIPTYIKYNRCISYHYIDKIQTQPSETTPKNSYMTYQLCDQDLERFHLGKQQVREDYKGFHVKDSIPKALTCFPTEKHASSPFKSLQSFGTKTQNCQQLCFSNFSMHKSQLNT